MTSENIQGQTVQPNGTQGPLAKTKQWHQKKSMTACESQGT
jgi:hypothetical protein